MTLRRRLCILGGIALCAMAASMAIWTGGRAGQPERVHSETLFVFGTLVEVLIYGEDEATARAATTVLGHQFQKYHRDWHAWRDGELTRLNAAIARGEPFDVGADLAQVLKEGQTLSIASDGMFDPAIGGLIELWGFHSDTLPVGPPPSPASIATLVAAHPTMSDLDISGTIVRSNNPSVQLDLGGYAKGSALDRAADMLRSRGIEDAVLNAGGDVTVLGRRGAREWRLAIRDPFAWGAVATLSVHPGESVFTSGNYERFLEQAGTRFSHIIDPRSGWPAPDIVSVTVVARNGALADAAATALSVAGVEGWQKTARKMGVDTALLIDGAGQLYASSAMAARLEIEASPDRQTAWPSPIIVPLASDPEHE